MEFSISIDHCPPSEKVTKFPSSGKEKKILSGYTPLSSLLWRESLRGGRERVFRVVSFRLVSGQSFYADTRLTVPRSPKLRVHVVQVCQSQTNIYECSRVSSTLEELRCPGVAIVFPWNSMAHFEKKNEPSPPRPLRPLTIGISITPSWNDPPRALRLHSKNDPGWKRSSRLNQGTEGDTWTPLHVGILKIKLRRLIYINMARLVYNPRFFP